MTETEQVLFYQQLGGKIRDARQAAGLKQEAFGGLLGLSRASIVNIEKGRQHPPIYLLWVIAKVLKIDVSTLLPSFEYEEHLNPKWEKLLSKKMQNETAKAKVLGFLEELRMTKS